MSNTPSAPWYAHWPLLLVLGVLALLPVGRVCEVPLIVAAAAALVLVWRHYPQWHEDRRLRLAAVLFACYWLPALFSALGAVVPIKSWSTVAGLLRFAPYVAFCIYSFHGLTDFNRLRSGIAAIVAFWALDAWAQITTGYSLGGPAEAEHLSGVFGAGNLKLGLVLATLAPFPLLFARDRFGRAGLACAFLLLLVPILLAGSRASWLSFALICAVILWRETRTILRFTATASLAFSVVALVVLIAWQDSSGFNARIERSLLALNGTFSAVDEASAGRLQIWHTAIEMGAAHPLTGVGVRGFRYAYAQYAQPNDRFIDPISGEGAAHAHQLLLELWSETGLLGLLGWLIGVVAAVRAWCGASAPARQCALAPALALLAMGFPLNTHLAFYSAWWGLLFWWLIALYCAALDRDDGHGA